MKIMGPKIMNNFLVIFTAAFTPIPYKVFSITAGVFQINLPIFIIASILGRGGRFIIIGLLIRFFGEPIKVEEYGNLEVEEISELVRSRIETLIEA